MTPTPRPGGAAPAPSPLSDRQRPRVRVTTPGGQQFVRPLAEAPAHLCAGRVVERIA